MRLRSLKYASREAVASFKTNGFMSAASISTVAISLLVLSMFLLLAVNLDHMAGTLENQVEITAYLKGDLDQAGIKALQNKVAALPGVAQAKFVSKDDALKRLRAQFGDKQDLLDAVADMNPLRNSFEIKASSPDQVGPVAAALKALPGVEEADYKQQVVERLFKFTRALRIFGLALVVVLAVATVFIISNTIRLTVFARRKEIAIMKLVGATDAFIRRPFIIEGMLFGVGGALAAMLLVWRAYIWALNSVNQSLPFLPVLGPSPLLKNVTLALFVLGAVLGAAGSALSIRRFLRV